MRACRPVASSSKATFVGSQGELLGLETSYQSFKEGSYVHQYRVH